VFVHGSQAAYRSASTRLSHSPIWFQIVGDIIDESGEDYMYPAGLFVPVKLPAAVIRRPQCT